MMITANGSFRHSEEVNKQVKGSRGLFASGQTRLYHSTGTLIVIRAPAMW
jgi:hypothetical protein